MSKQTTIIFGSTGTIGKALTKQLKEAGHQLILCGRDEDKLASQKQELSAAKSYTINLDEPEGIKDVFVEASKEFETIDGVVNCIGSLLLKPAHITSIKDFDETIKINLASAFYVLRGATKVMSKTGGNIVLISSAAAATGMSNHEAIAAAKGGIESMARAAASSYAPRDIRINVVAPGMVETQMTEKLLQNESAKKASESMHALGRIGAPDDIARAVAFLVDTDQNWITGQVLGVDGGLSKVKPRP